MPLALLRMREEETEAPLRDKRKHTVCAVVLRVGLAAEAQTEPLRLVLSWSD